MKGYTLLKREVDNREIGKRIARDNWVGGVVKYIRNDSADGNKYVVFKYMHSTNVRRADNSMGAWYVKKPRGMALLRLAEERLLTPMKKAKKQRKKAYAG